MEKHEKIVVRNPYSIRPYQHVLEPVCAYLQLAMLQWKNRDKYEGTYNVGPDESDCVTTGELVDLFCSIWGESAIWVDKSENNAPHEAGFLRLDCSKIKNTLNWKPRWHIKEAIEQSVMWSKVYLQHGNIEEKTREQILEYMKQY